MELYVKDFKLKNKYFFKQTILKFNDFRIVCYGFIIYFQNKDNRQQVSLLFL